MAWSGRNHFALSTALTPLAATLRRLALNLLKRDQSKKCGIRAKQLIAGWNLAYLAR